MRKSAELINKAMKSRDINKTELAALIGKTKQTVSTHLSKNSTRDMTFDVFVEYAKALGYEVALIDRRTRRPISSDNEETHTLSITIKFNGEERIVEF